uniref:TonB-dependent receptor n=1 Tax=Yoonia rhodophyticola TaxID=3137370 RepID=A0AAN0MDJ3_9RHOB
MDGFSFGGRAESWATDDLRIGVTAMEDETGVSTQRGAGVDLRYQMGDNSFVQLDYAESEGPGFETSLSDDGGLVFATNTGVDGTGTAAKIEAQLDLADFGSSRSGVVGGYFEDRTEGFSTLDHTVTADTGDERLYGVFANVEKTDDAFGYRVYADIYENAVGDERTEVGAELSGDISPRLSYDLGIENLDEREDGVDGNRTDVAARLTYAVRDDLDVYIFGQGAVASEGLTDNDRVGLGVNGAFGNGWKVGAEVSDGTGGLGARVLATQTRSDNSTAYFGYELDPGRALDAGVAAADNGGKYVLGGTRQISDQVSMFGENTYDIFGTSQELIGAYGVTYSPTDFLSYTVTMDVGQLRDDADGDIDRRALSFGVRYEDESLRAAGRIEVRNDDFEDPDRQDTNAFFVVAKTDYRLSDDARLLFKADYARTEANGASFQDGTLVDASLGYAYRPVDNERLNVLARYRYFYDDVGQEVDGVSSAGPVQESHVLSVDGSYDLNQQWTLGGKFGGRWTDSAATAGAELASNDAVLAVANARYHALNKWDILVEARHLELIDAEASETGFLGAVYRQVGDNAQVGVGYNFGRISSDLTDLTFDDQGLFLNIVAAY